MRQLAGEELRRVLVETVAIARVLLVHHRVFARIRRLMVLVVLHVFCLILVLSNRDVRCADAPRLDDLTLGAFAQLLKL